MNISESADRQKLLILTLATLLLLIVVFSASVFADDDRFVPLDKSKVPMTGRTTADFVPAGWKVEAQADGDLNGDSSGDSILTLIELKPAADKMPARAVVVLLSNADGSLKNAGVGNRLVRCDGCGNSMEDVEIKINKGVINVEQEWGNSASQGGNSVMRFRYDKSSAKFLLIGADFFDHGGFSQKISSESSNYLTGERKTVKAGRREIVTKFKPETLSMDDVDWDALEEAAFERIG